MPADPVLLHDRLSELVACLSGSPEVAARDAVEHSMEDDDGGDALRHVATALIELRRSAQRELVGAPS